MQAIKYGLIDETWGYNATLACLKQYLFSSRSSSSSSSGTVTVVEVEVVVVDYYATLGCLRVFIGLVLCKHADT